jgi:hypothetical protein
MSAATAPSQDNQRSQTTESRSADHPNLPAVQHAVAPRLHRLLGRAELLRAIEQHGRLFSTAAKRLFATLPTSAFGNSVTGELRALYDCAQQEQREAVSRLQVTLITPLDAEDIYKILSVLTRLIGNLYRLSGTVSDLPAAAGFPQLPALCDASLRVSEALTGVVADLRNPRALQYFLVTNRAADRELRRLLRESLLDAYSPKSPITCVPVQLDLLKQYVALRRRFKQTAAMLQQIHFKNA